jgi:hypothetical protein
MRIENHSSTPSGCIPISRLSGVSLPLGAQPPAKFRHAFTVKNPRATMNRQGFCIFINTFCQGPVPLVSDETGYVIFTTELEAQREIVDFQMTRLQQFLDGEREYEDAIEVEEYVVPVTLHPNGTITDADGNVFSRFPE